MTTRHIVTYGSSLLIITVLFSSPIQSSDVRYSNVKLGYIHDLESDEPEGDGGYSIGASYRLNKDIFIFGDYSKLDFEKYRGHEPEGTVLQLGAGYIHPFNDKWDINVTLSMMRMEIELGPIEEDDTGFSISGGFRGNLLPNTEGRVALNYENIDAGDDDDDFYVSMGGSYYIFPNISADVDFTLGDGKSVTLGGKFYF